MTKRLEPLKEGRYVAYCRYRGHKELRSKRACTEYLFEVPNYGTLWKYAYGKDFLFDTGCWYNIYVKIHISPDHEVMYNIVTVGDKIRQRYIPHNAKTHRRLIYA